MNQEGMPTLPDDLEDKSTDTQTNKELPLNPEAGTEAFEFHQKRFQKKSEEHNKRGLIERALQVFKRKDPRDLNPTDIAHEEALKDDEDFEKRKSEEMLEWEKQNKIVFDHLKIKKEDPDGEGKKYKTMVLVMGGGKKVSYSAGQLTAMHYMGYKNSVDNILGISGGGPVAAYFVAGEENGPKGTSLLAKEAGEKEFFDLKRYKQVMNIKHMGNAMRKGPKALDQQAVLDSHTGLYVAVNKVDNDKMEWIDVKTAKPGMVSALEATGNIPFTWGSGIEVNDEEYFDGGFGQIDLEELIEKFKPTDILILPSRPFDEIEAIGPGALKSSIIKRMPKGGYPGVYRKFAHMSEELRKLMKETKLQKNVDIAVLWPPDSRLENASMDPIMVETAIYESARDTFRVFGEEIRDVKLYRSPTDSIK